MHRRARGWAVLGLVAGFSWAGEAADPWGSYADLGGATPAGSVVDNGNDSYTVIGGGHDFWGGSDQGFYAYASVSSNFDARVRMSSFTGYAGGNNDEYARAGLMARNSTAGNSPMVLVWHAPQGATNNHFRTYTRRDWGQATGANPEPGGDFDPQYASPGLYLRMTRRGNAFATYHANDNLFNGERVWAIVDWNNTAGWAVPMPEPALLGVAVSSWENNAQVATAVFSNWVLEASQSCLADRRPIHYQKWLFGGDLNGLRTAIDTLPGYAEAPDSFTNCAEFSDGKHGDSQSTPQSDNFRARLSGVFVAPSNGNYTFYVASDDGSILRISPDEQPSNLVQIAYEPQWGYWKEYIYTRDDAYQYGTLDNQRGKVGGGFKNISSPVALQAGEKRYLEALMAEGGGGANLAVAVAGPGLPAVTNGSAAILPSRFTPSGLYQGHTWMSDGAASITRDPTNLTVNANTSFVMTATCDGLPPWAMRWQRKRTSDPDFVDLSGAGASNWHYSAIATYPDDDQAQYRFVVDGALGSATSAAATLTVLADVVPPELTGLRVATSGTNLYLRFSEAMRPAEAEDFLNYDISGGVSVLSAVRSADGSNVVLTTTPLTPGAVHTLTVSNLYDVGLPSNNLISPDPTVTNFTAPPAYLWTNGVVQREIWWGIPGGAVNNLLSTNLWPDQPSSVDFIASPTIGGGDHGSQYGMRYVGHLLPPVSGWYTFQINRDDAGRLRVGTNEHAASAVTLIDVGCCGLANSAAVYLEEGRAHYFDALVKEDGGDDYLDVNWMPPGAGSYSLIPSSNLAFIAGFVFDPQPQSQTLDEGAVATFQAGLAPQAAAQAPGEPRYAWERSDDGGATWNPIAGATGMVYQEYVDCNDAGAQFRYAGSIVSSEMMQVSGVATLTLGIADSAAPVAVAANGLPPGNTVKVIFNENLDPFSATQLVNYAVLGQSVVAIMLDPNGRAVWLTTASAMGVGPHTVIVSNVADASCNSNVLAASTNAFGYHAIPGNVQRDIYTGNVGPNVLETLYANPKWPANPDILDFIVTPYGSYSPDNLVYNNYGMRYAGHIVPAVSGNYRFEMHADDASQFRLSSDESARNATARILRNDGSCCAYDASAPIYLQAGKAYYFDGIMQDGGGNDYMQLRWELPSGGGFQIIPSANLSYGFDVAVAANPAPATTTNTLSASFLALPQAWEAAQAPGKVRTQWQRSNDGGLTWADVPGATSTNYTLAGATPADHGAQFRAVFSVAGTYLSVTSAPAALTVVDRPYVESVVAVESNAVRVLFSGPLAPGTALTPGNYQVTPGLNVNGVTFDAAFATHGPQSAVRLALSGALAPCANYTVAVANVTGTNGLTLIPDPTTTAFVLGRGAGGAIYEDFNDGVVDGGALQGSALIQTGVCKLTTAQIGQVGRLVLSDSNCGRPVDRFHATVKLYLGGGTMQPADGFSFNYGPGVPVDAEEGVATGLSVCADTYDNDGAATNDAVALEVRWNGALVARVPGQASLTNAPPRFYDVVVDMTPAGVLNLTIDGLPLFTNLQTPWRPLAGQFSFAARTGTLTDNHWVDDVCIRTLEGYGALNFVLQPANTTVNEGEAAVIRSAVNGSPCWTFQWYSNGVLLAGNNSPAYVSPPTSWSNYNGVAYRVVASNFLGAITSSTATLTITPDTNGPHVVYAVATSLYAVAVFFNEAMIDVTPGYAGYWTVTDTGGAPVTVSAAAVSLTNPRRVDLTLGGGMTAGQRYTVRASAVDNAWPTPDAGVIDFHGNAVSPNPASATILAVSNYAGNIEALAILPTNTMRAPGALAARGFDCRFVQVTNQFANDNDVAEQILAGTYPNQGPNIAGKPCYAEADVINYNWELNNLGRLTPDKPIPGIQIPPANNHDYFVMEARAYVELRPGLYRWGVNSDDGFRVTPATNAADANRSIVLGQFNGDRGSADTVFEFVVTEPGLYPVRLVWEEGNGGANCEFWDESLVDGVTRGINSPTGLVAYLPPGLLAPVILTCAISQTVNADTNCQAVMPDFAAGTVATAGCYAVAIGQSPAAGTVLGAGVYPVTIAASNGTLVSTCVATMTVLDVVAPSITCPPAQALVLDTNTCSALLPDFTGLLGATDLCGTPTLQQSPPPGTPITPPGANVSLFAWDAAGNTNSCVVSVSAVDPATNIWLLVRRGTTNAVVSWPVTCSGWTLEMATNPLWTLLSWQVVPDAPVAASNRWEVTVPQPTRAEIFRLKR